MTGIGINNIDFIIKCIDHTERTLYVHVYCNTVLTDLV